MSGRVFDFDSAIVRSPGRSVVGGLRAGGQHDPSAEGVANLHRDYVAALEVAGVIVETLPPLETYPDSVFVEDPAFVVPEGAILLRPGARSRAGESAGIAPALRTRFETILELDRGCAEGGDILILPDEILIGLSGRTDRAGAERFVELLHMLGRRGRIVETPKRTLHLKSDCSLLDEDAVIATPELAASGMFEGYDLVVTPEGEEPAANALRVNDKLLVDADFPRTLDILAQRGFDLLPLPVSEIRKIDAGLSCMSLRWKAPLPPQLT